MPSRQPTFARYGALLGSIALLAACGGGTGGQVTGLSGTLVLQNNGGEELVIKGDGPFTFAKMPPPGTSYNVTVRKQPAWQNCTVSQGSGTVSPSKPPDVRVNCVNAAARVTTLTGSGGAGWADGPGSTAQFFRPYGIAVAADGHLLVADTANHRLRKVSLTTGDTSTLAGSGVPATQDGNGAAASFFTPSPIALSAAGDAYVAEHGGHVIRKVTPAGDVTRFAGSGSRQLPTVNGLGTAASFYHPTGLAMSPSGDLYVAELSGYTIRKVSPSGEVTTFAGSGNRGYADGPGATAMLSLVYGMSFDKAGNLYLADMGNRRIRKVTPSGVFSTLAGSGASGATDGIGAAASFSAPQALTVDDDGNVFVLDGEDYLLRMVTPKGVVSTLAGQTGMSGDQDGVGNGAQFTRAFGIAVGPDGALYVSSYDGHSIRKVTAVR